MSEPVPIDQFEWVQEDIASNWSAKDIMALNPNARQSYILEVDLKIPEEIHDHTSDYPLCPERLEINKDMISPKSWLVVELFVTSISYSSCYIIINHFREIINIFIHHLLFVSGRYESRGGVVTISVRQSSLQTSSQRRHM